MMDDGDPLLEGCTDVNSLSTITTVDITSAGALSLKKKLPRQRQQLLPRHK